MFQSRAQRRTPIQFLTLRRKISHVIRLLMLLQQTRRYKRCFCTIKIFLSLLLFQCTLFDNKATCILMGLLMHLLLLKLALVLVEDGSIEHVVELSSCQRDRFWQCVISIFTVLFGREISHGFSRFKAVFLISGRSCLLLYEDFD